MSSLHLGTTNRSIDEINIQVQSNEKSVMFCHLLLISLWPDSSSSLSTLIIGYKGHPTKRFCIFNSVVNFQIRSESHRCDRRAHRFGRDRQESGVEERRSRGKEEDHHRSHTGTK